MGINGRLSGRRSGARVIGLLTTLPQDCGIAHSDLQIKDFQEKDKLFEWMEKI